MRESDAESGVFPKSADIESFGPHFQAMASEPELAFGAISSDEGGLFLRGVSMSDFAGSLTSDFDCASYPQLNCTDYAWSLTSEADYTRYAQHF